MSEQNSNGASGGIGLAGIFFIVLFVLKLGVGNTAVMNWSWWWITCPLWGGFVVVAVIVFVVLMFVAIFGK